MKRWLAVPTILMLATALFGLAGNAAMAADPVPFSSAVFNAYSTGTVIHADAVNAGATGPRIADANVAFSGATVASKGTGTIGAQGPGASAGQIINETSDEVQPTLPKADIPKGGNKSYARGTGAEVTLGATLPNGNPTIPLTTARVSSPAKSDLRTPTVDIPADPVLFASAATGEGHTDWNDDTCILGKPISQGLGFVADAQLLNAGTGALGTPGSGAVVSADPAPDSRDISQSLSQTVFVPPTNAAGAVAGPNFGLAAETRMTIAPITLFRGAANQVVIEAAGEWVLQAIAGGLPGTARVVYAPQGSPTPTTPLLRIIQGLPGPTQTITNILNTQQLFGPSALPIPLITIPGVATISIGEPARAIGNTNAGSVPAVAADGTSASAAVDVVRVTLLDGTLGDIRVGHMEAKTTVPAGGFTCPIPVSKDANPRVVSAGQKFTYTITIFNKFDCRLDPVKVVDTVTLTPGIKYRILGTSIPTSSTASNVLTWNNVGPMAPRTSKVISIEVEVASDSAAGLFTNTAEVTAKCSGTGANGTGIDNARIVGLAVIDVPVDVIGKIVVQLPRVNGGQLAETGQPRWIMPVGAAMILGGLALAAGTLRARRSTA